jgi:hypothetical protein
MWVRERSWKQLMTLGTKENIEDGIYETFGGKD